MGSQISALYHIVKSIIKDYNKITARISSSPGIPVPNSSLPFWTIPTSPIARHGAGEDLPSDADIVIIGAGITGTAIAKTILEEHSSSSELRVVMLEAREACSGATGRNGGHVCPGTYAEYAYLKAHLGREAALEILRFRLAHIKILLDIAEKEQLLGASQARNVVNYDVFLHPDVFNHAKSELESFVDETPEDFHESVKVSEDRETIEDLKLCSSTQGCIQKPGAAIHVYRFVTGILSNLVSRYSNFKLFTQTPCTGIRTLHDCYVVSTPRGEINTSHIVHATNAWSSHLLPGMRKKIVPMRAHMSAQRPGQGLGRSLSSCGFVFYPSNQQFTFDYLTQIPSLNPSDPTSLPSHGELMYGVGVSNNILVENLGISDDSGTEFQAEAYLAGSLQRYFGDHWGAEGVDPEEDGQSQYQWEKGRIKAVWSGIIGVSADMLPWVGRIPKNASKRSEPTPITPVSQALSPPGEWISAGFSGEGMVHAWLCGGAVARMMLRDEVSSSRSQESGTKSASDPPLPKAFMITQKRVSQAKLEDLMAMFLNDD